MSLVKIVEVMISIGERKVERRKEIIEREMIRMQDA